MDQLKCSAAAGPFPMLCTTTISNVLVTKTLIDGDAGLNVLSVETFQTLQVLYDQLLPTKPFSGVTDGSIVPIGQIRLPVTFGKRDNYHTELIGFDVAHIGLPYNAILGYPALTKFMATTHHGYNILNVLAKFMATTLAMRVPSCLLRLSQEEAPPQGPSGGCGTCRWCPWPCALCWGAFPSRIGRRPRHPPLDGLGGSHLEGL